jgi:Na+/H+-translocating membrane pyrophosphatase
MAFIIIGFGWWWLQTISAAFLMEQPVYLTALFTLAIWAILISLIGAFCVRLHHQKSGLRKFQLSTLVLITIFLSIHFAIGRLLIVTTTKTSFAQELQQEDIILNLVIFVCFAGITTLVQLLFAEAIVHFTNRMRTKP